jgi:glycine oxidase
MPSLAPVVRLGLLIEGDHAVDPRQLTAALVAAARSEGADVRSGAEVTAIETDANRAVAGVRLGDGEVVRARQVVVSAGSWAGAIDGIPESARVAIRPVKGQIMRLHDPAGSGLLTRVLRMQRGYIVPRGDGRYVLGATMEERGFDTTITAGAAYDLLRDGTELVPGVSELVIDGIAAGLRPATPDNRPAIGPSSLPGLHWAVGHYRHGILLAPLTAELIATGLAGEELPAYASGFSPERFASDRVAVEA